MVSASFRFAGLGRAGHPLVSRAPQRMLLGAVLIWIGFRGNIFARGALAFFKRIGIGCHWSGFLDERPPFGAGFLETDTLLRSASFKSMGMPCFFSKSAKASSASSCKVAIRPRPRDRK